MSTKAILAGIIKPDDLKKAQAEDAYCRHHTDTVKKKRTKNFILKKGILFFKTKQQ